MGEQIVNFFSGVMDNDTDPHFVKQGDYAYALNLFCDDREGTSHKMQYVGGVDNLPNDFDIKDFNGQTLSSFPAQPILCQTNSYVNEGVVYVVTQAPNALRVWEFTKNSAQELVQIPVPNLVIEQRHNNIQHIGNNHLIFLYGNEAYHVPLDYVPIKKTGSLRTVIWLLKEIQTDQVTNTQWPSTTFTKIPKTSIVTGAINQSYTSTGTTYAQRLNNLITFFSNNLILGTTVAETFENGLVVVSDGFIQTNNVFYMTRCESVLDITRMDRSDWLLIKKKPRLPLQISAQQKSAADTISNSPVEKSAIYDHQIQATFRYIYNDGSVSAWAPISASKGVDRLAINESEINNTIFATLLWVSLDRNESIPPNVRAMDFAVRKSQADIWKYLLSSKIEDFGAYRNNAFPTFRTTMFATYKGDIENSPAVPSDVMTRDSDIQVLLPHSSIPIRSKALSSGQSDKGQSFVTLHNNLPFYDENIVSKGNVVTIHNTEMLTSSNGDNANTTWGIGEPPGTSKKYGIVFTDPYGRSSFVQEIGELNIDYHETELNVYRPEIQTNIVAPGWATEWHLVETKCKNKTRIQNFVRDVRPLKNETPTAFAHIVAVPAHINEENKIVKAFYDINDLNGKENALIVFKEIADDTDKYSDGVFSIAFVDKKVRPIVTDKTAIMNSPDMYMDIQWIFKNTKTFYPNANRCKVIGTIFEKLEIFNPNDITQAIKETIASYYVVKATSAQCANILNVQGGVIDFMSKLISYDLYTSLEGTENSYYQTGISGRIVNGFMVDGYINQTATTPLTILPHLKRVGGAHVVYLGNFFEGEFLNSSEYAVFRPTFYSGLDTFTTNHGFLYTKAIFKEAKFQPTQTAFSNVFSDRMFTHGLSSFNPTDIVYSDDKLGEIIGAARIRKNILLVGRNAIQTLYVNVFELTTMTNQNILARGEQVLRAGDEVLTKAGVSENRHLTVLNNNVYGYDNDRGFAWRFGQDGLRLLTDVNKGVLFDLAPTFSVVRTTASIYKDIVLFQISPTLCAVFSDAKNRFVGYFTKAPDVSLPQRDLLIENGITDKNIGILYSKTNYKYSWSLTFYVNQSPTTAKVLRSIRIKGVCKPKIQIYTPQSISNKLGQYTEINPNETAVINDFIVAQSFGDMNDTTFEVNQDGPPIGQRRRHTGKKITNTFFTVTLSNNSVDNFVLLPDSTGTQFESDHILFVVANIESIQE